MGINDEVFIFENFLDGETCKKYLNTAVTYFKQFENDKSFIYNMKKRTVQLYEHETELLHRVKTFLEQMFSTTLTIQTFEAHVWPISVKSNLHTHMVGNRVHSDFNSIIYLNDDFEGGEFYTNNGVLYKPKAGTLTFFNGQTIPHGIKKTLGKHRYILIFWWLKPSFPDQDQVHGTEES